MKPIRSWPTARRVDASPSCVAAPNRKLLQIVGSRLQPCNHAPVGWLHCLPVVRWAGKPSSVSRAARMQLGLPIPTSPSKAVSGFSLETVRQVFDPAALTHPTWDERLWCGETDSAHWLFGDPASVLTLPSGREQGFCAAKRRFFFEHSDGEPTVSTSFPRMKSNLEEVLKPSVLPEPSV